MSYTRNVRLWFRGWWHLDTLDYVPGWSNGPRWWLTYAFNHGTRVLTGGACVSWSRWFWETRKRYRLSAFVTRLLNHADDDHGLEAPPALWGTTDTAWAGLGAHLWWLVALPALFGGVVAWVVA